jgi:hypothetical protein
MALSPSGLTGDLQTIVAALQQLSVQLGNLNQGISASTSSIFTQSTGTSATATAGGGAAPPATVDGYITVNVPGVGVRHVPYYR